MIKKIKRSISPASPPDGESSLLRKSPEPEDNCRRLRPLCRTGFLSVHCLESAVQEGRERFFPLHRRLMALLLMFLGCLMLTAPFFPGVKPSWGAEKPVVPAIGSGPYELYIFTDYFCGPCQRLEAELDPALQELTARNSVKIIFVDIPIHRQTTLYNRYYLYAARSAATGGALLRIRRELFALAGRDAAADEKKIVSLFKSRNIPFEIHDLKPAYGEFNRIITQFNVRATPTCVVKYSPSDVRTYSGIPQIRSGLAVLRAATAKTK